LWQKSFFLTSGLNEVRNLLLKTMEAKAYFLTKYGTAKESFELRSFNLPDLKTDEVLIEVEAFGLNYADVMARKGLYAPAPKPPGIIGYEVVGKVINVHNQSDSNLINKRVLAFTRFGGYASHVIANNIAVVPVTENADAAVITALATQYGTAYYAVHLATTILPDQWILQHAAAGGVGLAIFEMTKLLGAKTIGLTSRPKKVDYLYELGMDHVINYKKEDYVKIIKQTPAGGVHHSFNSVAGNTIKKDREVLKAGGNLILYGAAQRAENKKGLLHNLKLVWQMGLFSPLQLMMNSTGIKGINMLVIADKQPEVLQYCISKVIAMYNEGLLHPKAELFNYTQLGEAHDLLESGKSIGKLAITWK
jgi:NADPH:quinone reductase-like Zn-dependent oxidoreductase